MSLTLLSNKLIVLALACFITTPVLAAIGSITEQQGPDAQLVRNTDKLIASKGSELEMKDRIETANTKLNLTFEDNTKVAVTEQSKFVIDEFIYDPNANTGKLSMRVAMGTVRYASGGIAKNNRENVRVRTPTATISVRGTDFAMIVNEIGQSMITLLPSCPDFGLIENKDDENKCPVGEIAVSTDAGYVLMNQAYQTTIVAGSFQPPTSPKVLTDKPTLNNLLIIAPPIEFPKGFDTVENQTVSFLDVDFLEFNDLMKDFLAEEQFKRTDLDRDILDVEYLDNFLDLTKGDLGDALEEVDGVLPTVHKYPWIKSQSFYNEEIISIHSERPPHIAIVNTERDVNADLNLIQDGITANILQNGGGDVIINITQTQ